MAILSRFSVLANDFANGIESVKLLVSLVQRLVSHFQNFLMLGDKTLDLEDELKLFFSP